MTLDDLKWLQMTSVKFITQIESFRVIFGEKMDSVTRAKLGIDDAAELAYTTAEHHPYWAVLYNCTEITKTMLEKWHDEITPEELDEIKWNLKEIQNSISNIENKLKK